MLGCGFDDCLADSEGTSRMNTVSTIYRTIVDTLVEHLGIGSVSAGILANSKEILAGLGTFAFGWLFLVTPLVNHVLGFVYSRLGSLAGIGLDTGLGDMPGEFVTGLAHFNKLVPLYELVCAIVFIMMFRVIVGATAFVIKLVRGSG